MGKLAYIYILVLFMSLNAYCAEISIPKEEVAEGSKITDTEEKLGWASDKFMRGITNILTGWMEVPKHIGEKSKTEGPLAGSTAGLSSGFTWMLLRTGAGIWDAATFPGSLIIPDEKPVIDPPTVFEKGE